MENRRICFISGVFAPLHGPPLVGEVLVERVAIRRAGGRQTHICGIAHLFNRCEIS